MFTLIFSDTQFTVFCNCQAGIFGKLCKHKIGLLEGDKSILFNKGDEAILKQIYELVKKSRYKEMIFSYNMIKKQTEEAQGKEKKHREQIERSLKTGVEFFS